MKLATLLIGVAYLLVMNWKNPIPVDAGDGIQHFAIAQYSWADPTFLLHHWGKPLFTLLASPFAQISFKWYIVFNILVYAATCMVAFKLFDFLKAAIGYYLLFPLLLLCVPDYTYCVLGGMTETLFGLLMVALLYFGFRRKWYWFAIIASFTLFSRSEGMLVVVLALPVLLYNRQWKAIPFLGLGFVLYAIAGWFAFGSFWWYIEMNPYQGDSVYGSGPWWHYLKYWDIHAGILTLLLVPFGLFGLMVFLKRRVIPRSSAIVLFGFAIYIGIICIHSYLWAYGLRGSLGLTRIATLGLPGALLLILAGSEFLTRELHILPKAFAMLLLTGGIVKEMCELPYPLVPHPLEEILIQSADYVETNFPKNEVYYFHPLIAWQMGVRIKDPKSRIKERFFAQNPANIDDLKDGTIIIRDPAFGPKEQGLPFDFIAQHPEMKLVKLITTNKPYSVYTNEPIEIRIYKIDRR